MIFRDGEIALLMLFSGMFMIGRYESPQLGAKAKLHKPRNIGLMQKPGSHNADARLMPIGMPLFLPNDTPYIDFPEPGLILTSKVAQKELADAYIQDTSGIMPVSSMKGL